MKRLDSLRSLAAGAAAVTVALTAAAFWLSYEHLHDVAAANGLAGARAWAWPGTVDLFIIAGELLILRAALRGQFDWFAYLLAGVGSLGSIALNVAGVGQGAQPMEYIVAAVPPTAALVAFGALMRQVHEHLASRAVTTEVTIERAVVEPLPVVMPKIGELSPGASVWKDEVTDKVTTAVAAGIPRQVVTEVVTLTPADLRRDARKLNRKLVAETNRPVTIDQLRDEFGLSRRDAAALRRHVVDAK